MRQAITVRELIEALEELSQDTRLCCVNYDKYGHHIYPIMGVRIKKVDENPNGELYAFNDEAKARRKGCYKLIFDPGG